MMKLKVTPAILVAGLGLALPARAATTTFTLDPNQSVITVSGSVVGNTVSEQASGSLTTKVGGTILADVAGKRTAAGLDAAQLAHNRMRAHMLLGHPYTATQTSRRAGDVFTEDVIETWINYKMKNEVAALELRPHPYEFVLYFDI